MQNKVLIIGGRSFLAQHFIKTYHAHYQILAISRSRFDTPEGVEKLIVSDYFCINDVYFEGVWAVLHFAAIVHQPKTSASVYKRSNTDLPLHLAVQARRCGAQKFIQLSSIAVFGIREHIPTDRLTDSAGTGELTPYGRSKWQADTELLRMNDPSFNVCCIRPPMVYGGGPAPGNMARLIKLVQLGWPLPFRHDTQRYFLHVGNLSECIHLLLSNTTSGLFYPTDKRGYSTGELVNCIAAQLGIKVRVFAPPVWMLSLIGRYAPTLYRKLWGGLYIYPQSDLERLGYTAAHTLEEGLAEMIPRP